MSIGAHRSRWHTVVGRLRLGMARVSIRLCSNGGRTDARNPSTARVVGAWRRLVVGLAVGQGVATAALHAQQVPSPARPDTSAREAGASSLPSGSPGAAVPPGGAVISVPPAAGAPGPLESAAGRSGARPGEAGPTGTPPVAEQGDSVSLRLVGVDLRVAIQALGRHLDRAVLVGPLSTPSPPGMPPGAYGGPSGVPAHVTLETPRPVPRRDVLRLLRGLVESQGLEFVDDSAAGLYRVRMRDMPRGAPDPFASPRVLGPSGGGGPLELFVLRLRHVRAADVAATVNALYGRASALGESALRARGAGATLGQTLDQSLIPSQAGGLPAGAAPIPGAINTAGRPATLAGELTLVPDAATNALLVRASRSDYALIQAVVQELDQRPLQVLIEVLVAEVRRDSRFAFGVGGAVPQQPIRGASNVTGVSAGGVMGNGPLPDSTLGDFVLRVLKTGGGVNFTATLSAAQARGQARILSRPVLLATNGEPAEILVGSQRPFVQVQRSLPTQTAQRDQVVQYRDVGTRLSVRPTISADGFVALAVTQEVNQVTGEVQFDAPVISTRTVQTSLLVRDGQTIVLGGLADRQREAGRVGVPVLSRLPVLGALFGRTTHQSSETEFFLFITPRVVRNDDDATSVTQPLEARARRGQR